MVRDGVINLIAKIVFLDGSCDSIELSMKDAKEIEETLAEQEDQLKKIVWCKDCIFYNQEAGVCSKGHAHGYAGTWFCADGKKKPD